MVAVCRNAGGRERNQTRPTEERSSQNLEGRMERRQMAALGKAPKAGGQDSQRQSMARTQPCHPFASPALLLRNLVEARCNWGAELLG
jgi:hypothetical protein